jgi:hypothetical protein
VVVAIGILTALPPSDWSAFLKRNPNTLYRLQEAGCKLYTINGKEWTSTDLLTLIEAGLEGEKSEKELRDKSEQVIEAMRVLAEEGTWLGGRIPYGCDVVAYKRMAIWWSSGGSGSSGSSPA